jgi:hypothetical protein
MPIGSSVITVSGRQVLKDSNFLDGQYTVFLPGPPNLAVSSTHLSYSVLQSMIVIASYFFMDGPIEWTNHCNSHLGYSPTVELLNGHVRIFYLLFCRVYPTENWHIY